MCQRLADDRRRGCDEAEHPVDTLIRGNAPDLAGGGAAPGQLVGKEGRFLETPRHAVAIFPGTEGEEPRRFAKAVATDGLRFDGKGAEQVTAGRPHRHLADDQGVVIVMQGRSQLRAPEGLRQVLAGQELTPFILATEDLRPLCRELLPHAGKMISRTGEDKGDLAGRRQRLRCIEETITQRRRQGGGAIIGKRLIRVLREGAQCLANLFVQFHNISSDHGDRQTLGRSRRMLLPPAGRQGFDPRVGGRRGKVAQTQKLARQFRRRLPFQSKEPFAAGTERLAQRQRQRRAQLLVIAFEEDMGSTAIDSDRTDQSPPWSLDPVAHPELRGLREDELAPGADPFVTGVQGVAQGGNDLPVQSECRLHQGGQARGGAGIADVALDAANITGIIVGGGSEEGAEGIDLDLILRRATTAVRLQIGDTRRQDLRPGKGPLQGEGVGVWIRGRLRRRAARCRADTANDGIDTVAILLGVVEAFENNRRRPFTDDGAVRLLVEGANHPGGRIGTAGVLSEDGAQVASEIDGADQSPIDLPLLQGANPDFQGAQSRVLFAGDGETRPTDAELLGNAAGDDAAEGAHCPVGGEGRSESSAQLRHPVVHLRRCQLQVELLRPELRLALHRPTDAEVGGVEIETGADEDAGKEEFFILQPGILQSRISHLQHQQLAGEHLLLLFRRDAKLAGSRSHLGEKEAAEFDRSEPGILEPLAPFRPPPCARRGRFCRLPIAENPLREGGQRVPGAEMRPETDDGDRLILFVESRVESDRPLPGGTGRSPFLDEKMGIDAAETEGADRRPARHILPPR